MTIAAIKRRLAAITTAMRTAPDSLQARLARLSPADRGAYQFYQDRIAAWRAANPDRNYYDSFLAGDAPTIPQWLSDKLNGGTRITDDMGERDVSEVYAKMVRGEL